MIWIQLQRALSSLRRCFELTRSLQGQSGNAVNGGGGRLQITGHVGFCERLVDTVRTREEQTVVRSRKGPTSG